MKKKQEKIKKIKLKQKTDNIMNGQKQNNNTNTWFNKSK